MKDLGQANRYEISDLYSFRALPERVHFGIDKLELHNIYTSPEFAKDYDNCYNKLIQITIRLTNRDLTWL